jgi:hypothetical protein
LVEIPECVDFKAIFNQEEEYHRAKQILAWRSWLGNRVNSERALLPWILKGWQFLPKLGVSEVFLTNGYCWRNQFGR